MSHELTIRDDNALDTTTLTSDIDALRYEQILPDQTTELAVRNGIDGDGDTYGRYHYSDTEPKADIVADIEAILPDTATVDYRHTWAEYDDTKTNDATYYPSHWDSGLRAPPTVSDTGTTVSVSAEYLHGGTEYSDSLETDLPVPSDYGQVHVIVADDTGLSVVSSAEVPNPKENDTEWPEPDFTGVEVARVTMKSHIDRVPNGGIEVAEFPP